MRKIKTIFCLTILCASSAIFAENMPILNNVQMQLSAEQWVNANTALATIAVDETLINKNAVEAQSALMTKLASIAKAKWRIVSVNLAETQSGLQKMNVIAQARLSHADIADLHKRVNSMSQSGQKFTVSYLSFAPSTEEIMQATAALREKIYQQAKTELSRLDKVYPQQHYFIHQINFNAQPFTILRGGAMNALVRQGDSSMSVSRRLTQTATVTLSSQLKA